MTPITEAGVLTVLAAMREWWPPLQIGEGTAAAWLAVLDDVTLAEATDAVLWLARNSPRDYAPPPGVVRARVLSARGPDQVPALPAAVPHETRLEQLGRVRQTPEYATMRRVLADTRGRPYSKRVTRPA